MRWVYVDGSCKYNGRPEAGAGIGVWFGKNHKLNVSEVVSGDKHTNQVAEIQAATRAIRIAIREDFDGLRIYTDSKYVFNGINNGWLDNWSQNGWKNSKGLPVANQQDWMDLDDAINEFEQYCGEIRWRHVPSHSGNFGNDQADKLASEAAVRAYDEKAEANFYDEFYRSDDEEENYYSSDF